MLFFSGYFLVRQENVVQSHQENKRLLAVSGLCRYILLGILLLPAVGTAQAPNLGTAIENTRSGLHLAITDRAPKWRLQGLALPSHALGVDVDFEEVQVFAADSALVTEKGGKFVIPPFLIDRLSRGLRGHQ